MQLRIIEEMEIDKKLDTSIKEGLCICFPADTEIYLKTRAWHGYHPAWNVIIKTDNTVIAHAAVIDRKIQAGKEKTYIAGITNVFVLPEYRKKELSGKLMNTAMDEARRRNYELGLLFCEAELEKVYWRCGWKLLSENRIIRIDEKGKECPLEENIHAMYYPLLRTDFPRGDIHLNGNDW